jgi:hypothetical protein
LTATLYILKGLEKISRTDKEIIEKALAVFRCLPRFTARHAQAVAYVSRHAGKSRHKFGEDL